MYCTYDEYRQLYGGTLIEQADWFRYAHSAQAVIDQITFGRLKDETMIPNTVKRALCAAAECEYKVSDTSGRLLSSETTSKHSVSYATGGATTVQGLMKQTALQYLSGSPLLYRGIYRHEKANCHYSKPC